MALKRRCPDAGLVHHSDQGCTYASEDYQDVLDTHGITCSMSRRGNCYDNAVMESFFSTVKSELREHFESNGEAKMELEVGHDALVNLSREEAFQAADDVAFGPASGDASGDVVAGRLVELHPDDDGSIEGRVSVSVAASIEAVPTGGHPRRGRDRAGAAELREGGLRTNPVGVIAEDDQQLSRGVGAHTEALAEGR